MTSLLNHLFNLNAVLVYVVVTALVFAEDALFVGFVLPGETAAVLGGVIASQGRVQRHASEPDRVRVSHDFSGRSVLGRP